MSKEDCENLIEQDQMVKKRRVVLEYPKRMFQAVIPSKGGLEKMPRSCRVCGEGHSRLRGERWNKGSMNPVLFQGEIDAKPEA